MKPHFLLIVILFPILSCEDRLTFNTKPRYTCQTRQGAELYTKDMSGSRDTFVLYSAVCYAPEYDWVRDSLYGEQDYRVVLFRDSREIVSIPSSCSFVDQDYDSHHIINGSLYTEHSSPSTTYLGRDGVELFSFSGREMMKGILPMGAVVYTLSQNRSGKGLTYRKDGKVLLSVQDACVFGGLNDQSYGDTGALYEDNGRICFAFKDAQASYIVIDGQEQEIPLLGANTQDIKIRNDSLFFVSNTINNYTLDNGRLWLQGGKPKISGTFSLISTPFYGYVGPEARDPILLYNTLGYKELYLGTSSYAMFDMNTAKGVSILGKMEYSSTIKGYRMMSPKCAKMIGDDLYAALSPSEAYQQPMILINKDSSFVYINGYLSDIAVEISPPK